MDRDRDRDRDSDRDRDRERDRDRDTDKEKDIDRDRDRDRDRQHCTQPRKTIEVAKTAEASRVPRKMGGASSVGRQTATGWDGVVPLNGG